MTAPDERVYQSSDERGRPVLRCTDCPEWVVVLDEHDSWSTAVGWAEDHEDDHIFGKIPKKS